jgi:hypothetical protein
MESGTHKKREKGGQKLLIRSNIFLFWHEINPDDPEERGKKD